MHKLILSFILIITINAIQLSLQSWFNILIKKYFHIKLYTRDMYINM